jgi:hypothetical protein
MEKGSTRNANEEREPSNANENGENEHADVTRAADIIALYLNPPENAAVFCVDEKTCIQALDRRDRVLPLSPGRAERHGFEYIRHGTVDL